MFYAYFIQTKTNKMEFQQIAISRMKVHQKVYGFPYGDIQTNSLGNGAWEIKVLSEDGDLMFALQGSNGTHMPADDLWAVFESLKEMLINGIDKDQTLKTTI